MVFKEYIVDINVSYFMILKGYIKYDYVMFFHQPPTLKIDELKV